VQAWCVRPSSSLRAPHPVPGTAIDCTVFSLPALRDNRAFRVGPSVRGAAAEVALKHSPRLIPFLGK